MKKTALQRKEFRKKRIRAKLKGSAHRPRLAVFRSLRSCTAQLIDDEKGVTLVSGSERELLNKQGLKKSDRAKLLGELIAQKALQKGITKILFDRGGNAYHGRIAALADGARNGGLEF